MRTQKAFPQNNPKIDFAASFASPKQSPKKLFNELASQGNAKSLSTSGMI